MNFSSRHSNPMLDNERIDQAAVRAQKADSHSTVQLGYPRKGPWSGNNQLGVELPFELDGNRMQTILKLDEWGMPQVWTVSLAVALNEPLELGQIFDVIAEINFGSGGIVQSFECDWVNGTIFSLPMNALNVRARWSDLATINGILPPPGIRISTLIAHGSIRHARATKTTYFRLDPAFPGYPLFVNFFTPPPVFLPIPPFAKSVTILPKNPADAAILYAATTTLQFLENQNTLSPPILSVPGSFLGPTSSFRVSIPAASRYFTISIAPGPIVEGTFLWSLFDE